MFVLFSILETRVFIYLIKHEALFLFEALMLNTKLFWFMSALLRFDTPNERFKVTGRISKCKW